jgi:methylase of polypeptide subunit release factors
MRCVELGAGVGLVGLALAAMGARVTITDIDKVLPLMRDNLAANGFDPARG